MDVRFKDGSIYTYDESSVGTGNFEAMERKAEAGKGLSTMIARNPEVRNGFSRRRGAKG